MYVYADADTVRQIDFSDNDGNFRMEMSIFRFFIGSMTKISIKMVLSAPAYTYMIIKQL